MRKQLLVAGFAVLILSVDLAAEEPSPVAASSQSRPDTTKQQPGRSNMDSQIRRVVTGKDQDGKAVAILDGPAPNVVVSKERGTTSTLLWVTDSTPADIYGTTDATNRKIGVHPPANGTVFRIVEFPPENDVRSDYDTIRKAVRNQGLEPEGPTRDHPRHPGMHRTRTIDYALIISGEIDMYMDDTQVHLKQGDVVVQRGTNHSWVNRGTQSCKVAFILIDAKEPK